MHTMRTRSALWLAAALALALTAVWATVAWQVGAAPAPDESTVVNVAPERVLDTRDPTDLGFPGPLVSPSPYKLRVTGTIPTATGLKTVIPTGATGALLNVTSINSTADGFISIRPGDATGAPTTSSLNFLAGVTTPNAVQVQLPTSGPNAGQIDITYDALGLIGPTSDIFIDVVGYTKNSGLMDLITEKANVSDVYMKSEVYTRTEADARYVPHGDIVIGYGQQFNPNTNSSPTLVRYLTIATQFEGGNGVAHLQLEGPHMLGGVEYGLKSVNYCIYKRLAPAKVFLVRIQHFGPGIADETPTTDFTNRSTPGCYTVEVNNKTATSHEMNVQFSGGGGNISLRNVTATWAPIATLP